MSRSTRENDIRKLRKLGQAKSALIPLPCPSERVAEIIGTPAYMALQQEFDRLFVKYGCNPDIFKDNERAGSKRVVTKKIKDAIRRSDKRSEKQSMRNEVDESAGTSSDT